MKRLLLISILSLSLFSCSDYKTVYEMNNDEKKAYFTNELQAEPGAHPDIEIGEIKDASVKQIAQIRSDQPNRYYKHTRLVVNISTQEELTKDKLEPQLKSALIDLMAVEDMPEAVKFMVYKVGSDNTYHTALYAPNGNWADATKEDAVISDFKFVMN